MLLAGCPFSEPEPEFIPAKEGQSERQFHRQCRVQVNGVVSAANPFFTVKYTEPTTRGGGKPLKNLSHTTIYIYTESSLLKMKEVSATSPTGGGNISEMLFLPITQGESLQVTICVTATDSEGHES